MCTKIFIAAMTMVLTINITQAQTTETTDSLTRKLQEVVVTANHPTTKLIGSTLVSTIAGTNLSNIGNALDVLTQLPMIKVEDNTVSIIGRTNIEIYIDGRPMRDTRELQHILSLNLKKVELLMAPGAGYASTTDAVLKITTRRNFIPGLSLNDQFQLQRRRRWSMMNLIGMNYRVGRWDIFLQGTINNNNTLSYGSTTNSLVYNDQKMVVGSSQHNSYATTVGVMKAGFNYAKNAQSFGAYYRYNPENSDFNNSGAEWIDSNLALNRVINKRTDVQSHLASVYYENIFTDKYILHFDGDFNRSSDHNRAGTIYQESTNPNVKSTAQRKSTLWAGKLYMNFPLWCGDFTIGTQDTYTHTSLDYRIMTPEVNGYIPSSLTDARQSSTALFTSWARIFGKFSLSIGARYEYVDYDFKTDGKRDKDISHKQHLLTPYISLGYTFNDETQVSFSYKTTTVRPPYSQLTGSLNYVGLHEIEGGNPSLRDERMHNTQIFGMWRGFMFQADYTQSNDTYTYVKQIYPADNLQLLMHPINIDVTALSIYLIWSKAIRQWTPNITAGIYRQWLTIDNTDYNKPIFSYYFDNTLTLPHGWLLTANISGQTRGDMHTNRFGATWFTMDASVGKIFLNKSLTIKLTATDIFNTANYDWTMDSYGIFVNKRQSYDRRGISLTAIYNVRPHKSKYKGRPAAETEMKRI